jgi:uncharacterized protein YlzI (FlbEa/FlbD family)
MEIVGGKNVVMSNSSAERINKITYCFQKHYRNNMRKNESSAIILLAS